MKKIFIFICCIAAMFASTACRYAHEDKLGDTVAAINFDPSLAPKPKQPTAPDTSKTQPTTDSTDIFIIGDGSTRRTLQLLSYPSKRDTAIFRKAQHIRISGSADYGRVVRVTFFCLPSGDSLVNTVTEVRN